MFGALGKRLSSTTSGSKSSPAVLSADKLSFPFDCESPFLFAVYHLDKFPAGNAKMGIDRSLLKGHNMGADFGHPSGWNMYHGEEMPGFPKHPHRGFETITITRQGVIDHTDSLGNAGRFGYGDVQWMTAGQGINHAEMFPLLNKQGENVLELFQVWINLPKKDKMVPPSFKMLWAETLPTPPAAGPGDPEVALIAGSLSGFSEPPAPPPNSYAADPSSDVLIVTVKLPPGTSWTLPQYAGSGRVDGLNRNVYFYAGKEATIAGQKFSEHRKIKLRPDVDVVLQAGGSGPAEVLVLQGRDIGEPVVQHGPFVGTTRADITQAFSDYQRTGFGKWPWPSEAMPHARERPRFAEFSDGRIEERPMP